MALHTDREATFSSAKVSVVGNCRKTWPDEVNDLTPWVIDNLDLLAAQLGISLEFVEREVPLGTFRADILATDGAGRRIIIENQFGPTDHLHFGQIVLYACEASADVVIWLAAGGSWGVPYPVRPEHRRALAILNERFAGHTSFFGVEVEIRSDPRPMGQPFGPLLPRVTVVVRPDEKGLLYDARAQELANGSAG